MEKCKKVIQNHKYLGQLRITNLNYMMTLILYHILKIIIKKHEAVTVILIRIYVNQIENRLHLK